MPPLDRDRSRSRSPRGVRHLLAGLATAALTIACTPQSRPAPLLFLSDFGTSDDSVAICKGVMLELAPALPIIDITHTVTPYSVSDGARFLAGTTAHYPAGSVFLAVVDPGVGSTRRPMVARSKRGQYFVLPDNGLITLVADQDGLDGARVITNDGWLRAAEASSTFHGRDIFAPVAARLARGDDWTAVGPLLPSPVRLPVDAVSLDATGLRGTVLGLDGPYGNLVTNVTAADFAPLGYAVGDMVPVRVGTTVVRVPYVRTFSDVAVGAPLLYVDSRGRMALAVNQGDFARTHRVTPPAAFLVPRPAR